MLNQTYSLVDAERRAFCIPMKGNDACKIQGKTNCDIHSGVLFASFLFQVRCIQLGHNCVSNYTIYVV